MKLSQFRTSTYFIIFSFVLLLMILIINLLIVTYFSWNDAIADAKEKADIILDKNMAVHDYYSRELKPSLFKMTSEYVDSKGYFDPLWMSSTHAIMKLDGYFEKRNQFGYYYKDAAINARSEKNEADEIEKEYLLELNQNPDLPERSGVYQNQYYYLMRKGEIMEESCLRCHTTPDKAPTGLVKIYGNEKSFRRTAGEVISIISIRIPIDNTYKKIIKNVTIIGFACFIFLALVIVFYYFIQNKIIFKPLETITAKSLEISRDPLLVGQSIELNTTRDIQELIQSFNRMSQKLSEHQNTLEGKIREKTLKLEAKYNEIKALNIEKDKLFSIIAHDLRNPISGLLNLNRLLIKKYHDYSPAEMKDYLSHMLKSAENINELLENLLLWAKSQLNKVTLEIAPVQINDLIKNIIHQADQHLNEKQLSVTFQADEEIQIETDRHILELVIRNLLTNAIKFSNPNGMILLSVHHGNGFFEIVIIDNGIGMDEEKVSQLFNFESNVTYGTQNEKGSGLGLILCRDYLERINGTIHIESSKNRGTKVTVKIPE